MKDVLDIDSSKQKYIPIRVYHITLTTPKKPHNLRVGVFLMRYYALIIENPEKKRYCL